MLDTGIRIDKPAVSSDSPRPRHLFAANVAIGNLALVAVLLVPSAFSAADTTPPTIQITAPTLKPEYRTCNSSITISGVASDNVGVASVTWTSSLAGQGSASGTTAWKATIPVNLYYNLIFITAHDKAGNATSTSLGVTWEAIDKTAPEIYITSPTSGRDYGIRAPQVSLGGTASDASGINTVTWVNDRGGNGTARGTTKWTIDGIGLQNGQNFITVKARDAAGNIAPALIVVNYVPPEMIDPGSVLVMTLPRVPSDGGDEALGVALTNFSNVEGTLIFTAFDAAGALISGSGISNPVYRSLGRGAQVPILDSQLFGPLPAEKAWIRVESDVPGIRGLFLTFNDRLTELDGAGLSSSDTQYFAFPVIRSQGSTSVAMMNTNLTPASLHFELMSSDGKARSTFGTTIPGNGVFIADVAAELFRGASPGPEDYVRVRSSSGLRPFELVGSPGQDKALLPGLDLNTGAGTLYSPQYAVGGPWRSTLTLLNTDSVAGSAILSLFSEEGLQIGGDRKIDLAASGKVLISDPAFFAAPGDGVVQGYVRIVSDDIRLTGSVEFGDSQDVSFRTALPLVSTLQKSAVFGHVASNSLYFTGLSILNPNTMSAVATVQLCRENGSTEKIIQIAIPPRQRRSGLLTQFFPQMIGQDWTSGYVRVTSDGGLAGFALFGTSNLSVLAAIPAQSGP